MGSRYVELTKSEEKALTKIWQTGKTARFRNRAHALLLNNNGLDIFTLSTIFFVHWDTIGD